MSQHTEHFGTKYGMPILRFLSTLSHTCVSFIKFQEKRLESKCTAVWWQRNRLGETFLFGKFCHGREWIPVTLAYYHDNVGWVTINKDVIEFNLAHHPREGLTSSVG